MISNRVCQFALSALLLLVSAAPRVPAAAAAAPAQPAVATSSPAAAALALPPAAVGPSLLTPHGNGPLGSAVLDNSCQCFTKYNICRTECNGNQACDANCYNQFSACIANCN